MNIVDMCKREKELTLDFQLSIWDYHESDIMEKLDDIINGKLY